MRKMSVIFENVYFPKRGKINKNTSKNKDFVFVLGLTMITLPLHIFIHDRKGVCWCVDIF